VDEDRRATATGLLQMMGQAGAVAGISLSGAIVAAGHGPDRFATAFLVACGPALLALVAAGFIQPGSTARQAPADAAESQALQNADGQADRAQ
jgi:MFS family permease